MLIALIGEGTLVDDELVSGIGVGMTDSSSLRLTFLVVLGRTTDVGVDACVVVEDAGTFLTTFFTLLIGSLAGVGDASLVAWVLVFSGFFLGGMLDKVIHMYDSRALV